MRLLGLVTIASVGFGCASGEPRGSAQAGANAAPDVGTANGGDGIIRANGGFGPGVGRHRPSTISLVAAPSTATEPSLTPLHTVAADFAGIGHAQLLTTFRNAAGSVALTTASFDAAANVARVDASFALPDDVGPVAPFKSGNSVAGVAILPASTDRIDTDQNLGGHFFAGGSLLLGGVLDALAAGDLDGDGQDDLVVSDASGSIAVALQVGFNVTPSGFQYQGRIPLGARPDAIVTADLNGDGALDLAVVVAPEVAVLLGNGDGTFQADQQYVVGGMAGPLAVSDVNGDGTPDLVIAPSDDTALVILPGNGDGTFGGAVRVAVERNVDELFSVGDLDGDGTGDLIAHSNLGASVILGGACNQLRVLLDYDAPPLLAVGDLTGDGKIDIGAVAAPLDEGGSGFVSALRGLDRAQFFAARRFPQSAAALARGDFNGDGREDLAAGSRLSGAVVDAWLATHPPALLRHASSLSLGGFPVSMAMTSADFDGDGNPDVALTMGHDGGAVHILLGDGAGSFRVGPIIVVIPQPANDEDPLAIAVGHFHPGNAPDLAVSTNGGPVRVLLNRGDGTFDGPLIAPLSGTAGLAVADFDGDGHDDLAVATNVVRVVLGRGDGTFGAPIESPAPPGTQTIRAGDFNGDGLSDVAMTTFTPVAGFEFAPLVVLAGDGQGRFPTTLQTPTGDFVPGTSSLAIADYNHDGIDDIVLALDGRVDVYEGARAPVMTFAASYRYATRHGAAIGVDLSGHERASVAVGGDSLLILRNDTPWR